MVRYQRFVYYYLSSDYLPQKIFTQGIVWESPPYATRSIGEKSTDRRAARYLQHTKSIIKRRKRIFQLGREFLINYTLIYNCYAHAVLGKLDMNEMRGGT